ncbi:MAG: ABC transporter transmembrane domain-containing protein, partial [Pseudomonadota bacterium]
MPWRVTGGAVEVYLVAEDLRRMVAAIQPGAHVFPLATGAGAKLALVAPSGAALAPDAQPDLAALAQSGRDWVTQALANRAAQATEIKALALRAGDRGAVEAGTVLTSAEPLIWIDPQEGGLQGDGLATSTPVALLQGRQASATRATEVSVLTTEDLAQQGRLMAALARFTAALAPLFAAEAARRDASDAERLAASAGQATAGPMGEGTVLSAVLQAAAILKAHTPPAGLPDPGSDLAQLPQTARLAGLRARRVALEGDWWRRDQGPLVVRHEASATVECLIFQGGQYRRTDRVALSKTRARAYESGAYALHAPLPGSVNGFIPLAKVVWTGMRQDSTLMAVGGAGIAALGILTPLATSWILTDIVPAGAGGLLAAVGIALAMAALISAALGSARGLALARINGRGSFTLAAALTDRVLRLPAGFFKSHSAGDLGQRIGAVEAIRQLVTSVLLSSGMTLVFSVVYLVVLFFYDTRLALIALGLTVIYILATALSRVLQMKSLREAAELDGKIASLTYETLEGVGKLRSAAAEHRAMARWSETYRAERMAAAEGGRIANHFAAFSDAYQTLTLLCIFAATALLAQEALPSGVFIAFLAAFGAFQGAFTGFCQSLLSIYAAKPLLDRALPVLTAEPELAEGRADPGRLTGAIEVSNLAFAYGEGNAPVLDGLSFDIRPGEHLAIVG